MVYDNVATLIILWRDYMEWLWHDVHGPLTVALKTDTERSEEYGY
jgi:hypothetical protein